MPYYDVDFPIRGVITRTVRAGSKKAAARRVRALVAGAGDQGIESPGSSLVFVLDEPPVVDKIRPSAEEKARLREAR